MFSDEYLPKTVSLLYITAMKIDKLCVFSEKSANEVYGVS